MEQQLLRFPVRGLMVTALVFGLAPVVSLATQTAGTAKAARFEVASVKRSPDPATLQVVAPDGGTLHPGGRWVAAFVSMRHLIRLAYPGHDFFDQIVGGPSWLATDNYHIEARTTPGATVADVPAMLRVLLEERFALVVRAEMRELRGYELVRARQDGRTGPGLRSPEVDCDEYRAARARGEPIPKHLQRYGDRLPCVAVLMPNLSTPQSKGVRLTAGGVKIADLLVLIGGQVGRPVVDRTGLTGVYDVEVVFSSSLRGPAVGDVGPTDAPPLIFQALQEQAGLKLNDTRLTTEVLVVERAMPPSEN